MAPIALLAVAATATVGSMYYGKKQAKYAQQSNKLQAEQYEIENARARRDEIRKARLAHGAARVTAEGQGVAASSGAQGGQGSIISQGNSNLSFLDRSATISDQMSTIAGKSIKAGNYAQMFAGVSDLAMTFASYGGNKVKAPTETQPVLSSPIAPT